MADEALETAPSTAHGPDDTLRDERLRLAVLAGINELPEVYQSALRLHDWMGTSMRAIAAMLDVPENTVKSYLCRARRLLQTRLAERGVDAR